jgi:AcrR family transcriptional regulator
LAILRAAREILLADGLGKLTVEAVAARAGVGKPTIYRNWKNAQELAMAAFLDETQDADETRVTGSARIKLVTQLELLIRQFATVRGRQITLTLASADQDSEIAKAFRNRIILKSREEGRAIVEAGVASGEFALPRGIEVALDLIYGPIFYRLLAGHRPLEPGLATEIVETLCVGFSPRLV